MQNKAGYFKTIKSIFALFSLFCIKEKFRILLLVPLMIFNSFVDVLAVGIVPLLISTLVDPEFVKKIPVIGSFLFNEINGYTSRELLLYGLPVVFFVFLIKNIYNLTYSYIQLATCKGIQVKVIDRIFRCYQRAPLELLQQENFSNIARIVYVEVRMIFEQGLQTLIKFTSSIVTSSGIFASLLFVDYRLTLLVIATLAVLFPAYGLGLNNFSKKLGTAAFNLQADFSRFVTEGLLSNKESRSMGLEERFEKRVSVTSRKHSSSIMNRNIVDSSITPLIEVVAIAGFSMIVYFQIAIVELDIAEIIPTLSLFSIALVRLRSYVAIALGQWNTITYRSHAVFDIVERIHKLESILKKDEAKRNKKYSFDKAIELKHVDYSYPNRNEKVLSDINLRIPKGSKIAIVGETGAGKTTLVDVILGLLTPNSGEVTIDGVSVDTIYDLSDYVGYVPQYVYLNDASIRENLDFYRNSNTPLTDEQMWAVLRKVQLYDMVDSLENKLDHQIGENGKRFSGGQRQRLGIARVLLRNPEILILDEGTSSLDERTESRISEVIQNLRESMTIIIISHRRNAIEFVDFQVRVGAGTISIENQKQSC